MSILTVAMAFLVISVLCICVGVVLIIKSRTARGDDRRKCARINLLWGVVFGVIVCGQALFSFRQSGNGRLGLMIILPLLAVVLMLSVFGLRSLRTEAYFRKLYDHDPGCCGRCGYDLTGNVSGVCPECGWKLPDRKE